MKALHATAGSRGDVKPMAVLSAALVRHGPDVTLAAPTRASGSTRAHGATPAGAIGTRVTDSAAHGPPEE